MLFGFREVVVRENEQDMSRREPRLFSFLFILVLAGVDIPWLHSRGGVPRLVVFPRHRSVSSSPLLSLFVRN